MRNFAHYIHQQSDWPAFTWRAEALEPLLGTVRHEQGRMVGRLESLGLSMRREATLETLTLDVLKSSEIEGELLPAESVRSSLAHRLGLDHNGPPPANRAVEGVVAMTLDATQNADQLLTAERLFGWHAALFPAGQPRLYPLQIGAWRSGVMQVVSGALGKERVHFEAPAAERVAAEMQQFLAWFNGPATLDAVLKAGVAHLWFLTIHPFDDGNGRIARALADMLLARADGSGQRFYSLSAQLQAERKAYYTLLERTQRGPLDITAWLIWFVECLGQAVQAAGRTLAQGLAKARFWQRHAATPLNSRQRQLLNRLLNGFEGSLTSSKWARMAQCSQDTATRDLQNLAEMSILIRKAGGRSTRYELADG